MTSPDLVMRIAFIDRLLAATAVTSLLGGPRVYENVPIDVEKPPAGSAGQPYVQYRGESKPYDTTTERGREHKIELNVWTFKKGSKQANEIMAAIETNMRDALFALTGGHVLTNLEFEFGTVFRDGEGQTYCGYQRWRAVTEES